MHWQSHALSTGMFWMLQPSEQESWHKGGLPALSWGDPDGRAATGMRLRTWQRRAASDAMTGKPHQSPVVGVLCRHRMFLFNAQKTTSYALIVQSSVSVLPWPRPRPHARGPLPFSDPPPTRHTQTMLRTHRCWRCWRDQRPTVRCPPAAAHSCCCACGLHRRGMEGSKSHIRPCSRP